ncbi:MAG: NIF family HAD-type phosphatase [Chitinophagales bacterium]
MEFVWGRSRCVYRRNWNIEIDSDPNSHYFNQYHYVKPLQKLKRKGFRMARMLIVDDSPHKCQDNYGNAIYPSEFKGTLEDNELEFLLPYLKTLKDKADVRRIEKRRWRSELEGK